MYQYRSLPLGLNETPRLFSKLMRYAIEPLSCQRIRLVYYLHDICLIPRSKEDLFKTIQTVKRHLKSFEFIINEGKSIPASFQTQEFQGFQFNQKKMKITVPLLKISNLLQKIKQASQPIKSSCRWIAALLGKVASMTSAIGEALLHIHHLQQDLAKSLQLNNQNWEKPCQISQQSQQVFQWWRKSIVTKNGLLIQSMKLPTPQITIYTDSFDSGWGVNSPMTKAFGFWNKKRQ